MRGRESEREGERNRRQQQGSQHIESAANRAVLQYSVAIKYLSVDTIKDWRLGAYTHRERNSF